MPLDRVGRVQAGYGILEDRADACALYVDRARMGQEPQERSDERCFAAARTSDETQNLIGEYFE